MKAGILVIAGQTSSAARSRRTLPVPVYNGRTLAAAARPKAPTQNGAGPTAEGQPSNFRNERRSYRAAAAGVEGATRDAVQSKAGAGMINRVPDLVHC